MNASPKRSWRQIAPLAALILAVGFYRQHAKGEGLFQPEGLVNRTHQALEQWWRQPLRAAETEPLAVPPPAAGSNAPSTLSESGSVGVPQLDAAAGCRPASFHACPHSRYQADY